MEMRLGEKYMYHLLSCKNRLMNQSVENKIQQVIRPYEDLLVIVEKIKLKRHATPKSHDLGGRQSCKATE